MTQFVTRKQIEMDAIYNAAPEMLELLEAIAEYWKEYEKTLAPLHPGALITERDECIAELVRAVVREARTCDQDALRALRNVRKERGND